jgi:hypothetical protein
MRVIQKRGPTWQSVATFATPCAPFLTFDEALDHLRRIEESSTVVMFVGNCAEEVIGTRIDREAK